MSAQPDPTAITLALLNMAQAATEERWRRERERNRPINRVGRAAHGLWRSIVTGGWE